MTQTTRQAIATQEDAAIAANVTKIETAKRPSALEVMAGRLNISAQGLKNTLMATVFKGAKDDEFASLIIVANEYNLNPLLKEIYAFPAKVGGIVPMVSVDGWCRIMNDHAQFDGIDFEDKPDANGELYAIEATIWRKDRTRPTKVTEYLEECKRNTDPWRTSPARMLRHRALMQCARYAFGFSGILSDDEIVQDGIAHIPETPEPTRAAIAAQIEHHQQDQAIDVEVERALDAQASAEGRGLGDDGEEYDEDGVLIDHSTDDETADGRVSQWLHDLGKADAMGIRAIEAEFLKVRAGLGERDVATIESALTLNKSRVKGR